MISACLALGQAAAGSRAGSRQTAPMFPGCNLPAAGRTGDKDSAASLAGNWSDWGESHRADGKGWRQLGQEALLAGKGTGLPMGSTVGPGAVLRHSLEKRVLLALHVVLANFLNQTLHRW